MERRQRSLTFWTSKQQLRVLATPNAPDAEPGNKRRKGDWVSLEATAVGKEERTEWWKEVPETVGKWKVSEIVEERWRGKGKVERGRELLSHIWCASLLVASLLRCFGCVCFAWVRVGSPRLASKWACPGKVPLSSDGD